MSNPPVKFKLLSEKARMPHRASTGAACWDLYAAEEAYLSPVLTTKLVGTGVAVELPPGHVGLVCSRSGLADKDGVFVLNAPGVIDEDYRGEIKVILAKLPDNLVWPNMDNYLIMPGLRIAQLMVLRLAEVQALQSANFTETDRGSNGFGSTGTL